MRFLGLSSGPSEQWTERSASWLSDLVWVSSRGHHRLGGICPPPSPGLAAAYLLGITEATLFPQSLASPLPHVMIDCQLWTPPSLLPHFCRLKGWGLQVSVLGTAWRWQWSALKCVECQAPKLGHQSEPASFLATFPVRFRVLGKHRDRRSDWEKSLQAESRLAPGALVPLGLCVGIRWWLRQRGHQHHRGSFGAGLPRSSTALCSSSGYVLRAAQGLRSAWPSPRQRTPWLMRSPRDAPFQHPQPPMSGRS